MTCKEKLKIEHPDKITEEYVGGYEGCPECYGYLPDPEWCNGGASFECDRCWDREIPETDTPRILDSGQRREFGTGAVRDIQEGKGRCDLMPLQIVGEYIKNDVIKHIGNFQQTGNDTFLYAALSVVEWDDPYTIILEVAKHFEEGAKKYGEWNWQKGIPTHCYVDSAVRHYLKHMRGDNDEPHDRAFVWNILCCIWTCIHKPDLNDYPFVQNNNIQGE